MSDDTDRDSEEVRWKDQFRQLGRGEVYHPRYEIADGGSGVRGRILFLTLVSEMAPEVLRDLYQRCYSSFGDGDRARLWEGPLSEWARSWKLDEPWVRQYALNTLGLLREAESGRYARSDSDGATDAWLEDPRWCFVPYDEMYFRGGRSPEDIDAQADALAPEPFRVSLPPWNPQEQTRSEYMDFARSEFEEALETYQDETLERYEEVGYDRVVRKRARAGPPDMHFRWLVRFQVSGEPIEDIARNPTDGGDSVRPRNVQEALRKASDLIGLTRRTKEV